MASEPSSGTASRGKQPVVQDHELLRCIGRGSYGEVRLARNIMGTYRAVKLVYKREFADARSYERELEGVRSFEPVSRSHEGFVDILQIGADPAGKYFYYVMELADDVVQGRTIVPETYQPRTLKEDLDRNARQPAAACVELGLALSGALSQLHSAGLVHRDIKPANIVFVEGRPKLADIGLVAPLNPNGSFVGTEGFVPPEGPNAFPADLYALGKVLYEMSTGKDRKAFPELPLEWTDSADHQQLRELNEVILRACEPEVASRYHSAKDMHADLAVLGAGKSVRWQRTLERRLARLKRFSLALALVLLVLGGFYFEYERGRAERASLRQRQVGLRLAEGTARVEAGDFLGALPHYTEALRLDAGDAQARLLHQLRLETALAQAPKLVRLWSSTNGLEDLAFGPDGARMAAALSTGALLVLDPEKEAPLYCIDPKDPFLDRVVFSPDASRLLTTSHSGSMRWFRADTGDLLMQVDLNRDLSSAQFSPDGARIACACRDGKVLLLDGQDGRPLKEIAAHSAPLWSVAWSPDGRWLLTTSQDQTAAVWDIRDGTKSVGPLSHQGWVYHGQFSPDGQRLATAGFDRSARLWAMPSGRPLGVPMPHKDGVVRVVFSPDGQMIATASLDGTVGLWDGFTAIPLPRNPLLAHSARLAGIAFSPDGRRLGTACLDGTIRLWDFAASRPTVLTQRGTASEDGRLLLTLEAGAGSVRRLPTLQPVLTITGAVALTSATLTPEGHFALTSATTGPTNAPATVWRAWSLDDGATTPPILAPGGSQAKLSEDGRYLAVLSSNRLRLEALTPNSAAGTPLRFSQPVEGFEWSPDSRYFVAWGGNAAWLGSAGPDAPPPRLLRHSLAVAYARFSPDHKWVATCDGDKFFAPGSVRLWAVPTGLSVGAPCSHRDGVLWVSFSPDSQKLVTGSEDFTARVWSVRSSQPLTPPLMHPNQVKEAAFSADGRMVITVCANRTVRIWDAASGLPLTPPLAHFERVDHAALAADGGQVFTWRNQGPVWQWPLIRASPPAEDWVLFSQVLSASLPAGGAGGEHEPLKPAIALQTAWRELSARYPQALAVTSDAIDGWHQQQAASAEQNRRWGESLFHVNRLVLRQPTNLTLLEWRDRLRERLQSP